MRGDASMQTARQAVGVGRFPGRRKGGACHGLWRRLCVPQAQEVARSSNGSTKPLRRGVVPSHERTGRQADMQTGNRSGRQGHHRAARHPLSLAEWRMAKSPSLHTGHRALGFPCVQANMQTGDSAERLIAEPIPEDGARCSACNVRLLP